ncbi:hypothetical protein K439DRAFT_1625343 [Ramaria rubella]|nr:hypothetical protein K439DRAFT_1625343 [Ramaria rubella]
MTMNRSCYSRWCGPSLNADEEDFGIEGYSQQSTCNPKKLFGPHRDSHILVKTPADTLPSPCSIQDIFAHRHAIPGNSEPIVQTFLIVWRYLELRFEDKKFDYWWKYSVGGGRLYYDDLQEKAEILCVSDIILHFAKTPYALGKLPGLSEACIHVLPLNWVSDLSAFPWNLINDILESMIHSYCQVHAYIKGWMKNFLWSENGREALYVLREDVRTKVQ